MASYPSAKVHRASRRKLGRGQHVQLPIATVAVTGASDTATFTFSQPVIVNGPLAVALSGLTIVSQTVVSSTVVNVLYSGAVSGKTWTFSSTEPVATYQGGSVAPATGTF